MSDAIFQRSVDVSIEQATPRPLPVGYAWLLAAAVSFGLWAGLVWLVVELFD